MGIYYRIIARKTVENYKEEMRKEIEEMKGRKMK